MSESNALLCVSSAPNSVINMKLQWKPFTGYWITTELNNNNNNITLFRTSNNTFVYESVPRGPVIQMISSSYIIFLYLFIVLKVEIDKSPTSWSTSRETFAYVLSQLKRSQKWCKNLFSNLTNKISLCRKIQSTKYFN